MIKDNKLILKYERMKNIKEIKLFLTSFILTFFSKIDSFSQAPCKSVNELSCPFFDQD